MTKIFATSNLETALQDCLAAVFEQGKTLEEALSLYPHWREELSPLLESALWMRAQQRELSLPPQRKLLLQQRILHAIRAEPLPSVRREQPVRPRLAALFSRPALAWSALILVFIFMIGLSTTGVAFAAQGSLPGEPLYAVKAAVEEATVLLNWDAAQRTRLRLDYAQRRLDEVARLSQQGRYEQTELALSNYEVQLYLALQEAERAARVNPLQASQLKAEIEARLQTQATSLAALESLLPPAQVPVARQAQTISLQAVQALNSLIAEVQATLTPTATLTVLTATTDAGGQLPLPAFSTPTASFVPPGLLRQTQSPTPRPSLTPRPTNTHRPTQIIPPSKTAKPTQVKPPKPTPQPTNPNKPTSQPPPGQDKPTRTPKK